MKTKKILLDTLSLTVITLVAVFFLSFVYQMTKQPIADAEREERQKSYRDVFQTAEKIEPTEREKTERYLPATKGVHINDVLYAKDKDGKVIGAVASVTSANGYGGEIVLSVGIDIAGRVTGVKVTSMSETSGLGAHCTDEGFGDRYIGKTFAIGIAKDGNGGENDVDAISSATVTTTAVTEAVNEALRFSRDVLGFREGGETK